MNHGYYFGTRDRRNYELEKVFESYDENFVGLFCQTFNVQYVVDGYYRVFGGKNVPDGYQLHCHADNEYYSEYDNAVEYQFTDGYGNVCKTKYTPWNNYFMIKHYNGQIPCVIYNMEPEQIIQKFNRFKNLRAFL